MFQATEGYWRAMKGLRYSEIREEAASAMSRIYFVLVKIVAAFLVQILVVASAFQHAVAASASNTRLSQLWFSDFPSTHSLSIFYPTPDSANEWDARPPQSKVTSSATPRTSSKTWNRNMNLFDFLESEAEEKMFQTTGKYMETIWSIWNIWK